MEHKYTGKTRGHRCIRFFPDINACTAFLFWALSAPSLFAQWGPDVRLTANDSSSYTSANNTRNIAASGDTVYVVWCDNRNGGGAQGLSNYEIYYKRSVNDGNNWEPETRLTNDSCWSVYPCVAASGSKVHIVWENDGFKRTSEIKYMRSTDGGVTWNPETRLTNNTVSGYGSPPSLSAAGAALHMVWQGGYRIYYKRSTDDGVTWSPDLRLSTDSCKFWRPSVATSRSLVHVVWFGDSNCKHGGIFYKRSTDEGRSWKPEKRLTKDPSRPNAPCVDASGSNVHVVWQDFQHGQAEVYYKRSTDEGATWLPDIRLTNDPANSSLPSIAARGAQVHVVWWDGRDRDWDEIYYKRSTDGGRTWEKDERLTDAPGRSAFSSVSISGQTVHVVWVDERDKNSEIYYKRNPKGN